VVTSDGRQLGVLPLHEAINMARAQGVDLVEVAPNATPPVCRIVDFGKYTYEQAKRDKESKKNQHSSRLKEIQLRPAIDPHDFGVKLGHAVDFLCEDMKVKLSLRYRGREMAHQEIGVAVVQRFIRELAPYGLAIDQPKIVGRSINVIVNPLPRNKRAKNPRESAEAGAPPKPAADEPAPGNHLAPLPAPADDDKTGGFVNNPFAQIETQLTPQAPG
jgi:translation initiation factor IF-3